MSSYIRWAVIGAIAVLVLLADVAPMLKIVVFAIPSAFALRRLLDRHGFIPGKKS